MPSPLDIFNAYPKPRRRYWRRAKTAIGRAIKEIGAATLLERTKAYAVSVQWRVDAGQHEWKFIPLATSWFNGGGYNDPPEERDENSQGVGPVKFPKDKYKRFDAQTGQDP